MDQEVNQYRIAIHQLLQVTLGKSTIGVQASGFVANRKLELLIEIGKKLLHSIYFLALDIHLYSSGQLPVAGKAYPWSQFPGAYLLACLYR